MRRNSHSPNGRACLEHAEDLKSEPCTVMGLRDATFSRENEQEKKTHLPITKGVIRKTCPFLTLDIRIMAIEIIVSLKLVKTLPSNEPIYRLHN